MNSSEFSIIINILFRFGYNNLFLSDDLILYNKLNSLSTGAVESGITKPISAILTIGI
jgi:hypothetical protein